MSAKKKRLGSRRRLADQSETNTDIGITDTTSVAQCHIPEERTASLNATADLHEAQCETQPPPSPDLLGNRRKLGSSRRSRVQPNPEPTEEVEPSSRGAALQPERQADVLPDCASEAPHATVTKHSEVDLESFGSMSENETPSEGTSNACSFEEATQEAKKKSDLRHTDEVNVGVGVSEFAGVVSCETDQQLIESSSGKEIVEEKLPNVGSVTEKPSDDETEMFTTESINGAENTEIESSLQQGTVSSPKGEMPAEVAQHEHLNSPEVAQARHSEDAVNKVHENEITLMGMREIAYSSESETNQAELLVKNVHDFPNNQSISIPDSKTDEHPEKEQLEDLLLKSDNDHVYDTRKPRSSDIEVDDTVLGQVFEVEDTVHEQDVEPAENQEKPQIDFSFEKVTHDATENSEIIPRNLMDQIEVSDSHQSMMAMTNTDDSSISLEESSSSLQTHQSEINVPLDPQLQQTIGHRRKMGSRRKNKGRLHVKDSGAESDQEPSVDVVGNTRDNETQEDAEMALKIEPTENLEKPQIDFSFEKVTHDAKDNSEIIPGNLMNQIEVSDTPQSMMAVTNTDDSLINLDNSNPDNTQQEHPKEENYFETSDQTNEDYDVCDTRKTQISEIERVDTCQVFEGDTNPSVDQTAFQEKEELLEESSSSLQTHQSEINVPLDPQLQQTIGHRRKMGSRRKNKARLHVNDSGAESDQEPSVDVVGNTRDNETQEDTEETEVQEKSIETLMKETDQFDTAHTEGVSDQVNENALDDTPVGIADLTSLGLQSSLTAGHLEIDQSNFSFTPDEEPPNVCSVTGKENIEGDEDTEWLRQDGNLRDTYLLSEDMESSFPPEKTREEQSSRERTGPECSGQLDIMSPLKEEVHTNEGQDDNFNSPEVTGDDRSEDAVVKVHEQDVESREDQEKPQIDFSFEKVTHDATDNSEINPRNLMNQIEVSDTHQSMMAVTNTDDSSISLEESSSSLQTHQSEINVPLDPQLQQTIGHRRKMGSKRKNKGRLHVKDSGAESDQEPSVDVVGNTRDNETQEDAEMALKIEPTENLEKPQIDFSFEKVTHDAKDNSEIIPGNLMNQIEVSDTPQSMMAVTNTDDSLINLDNSNPDNTQQEHPKEENYFETSDQTNEDYDVCDTRKTQISEIERVDTCQVFEGDTNPSVDQTAFQEKEELLEESSSSLQTHQSEINVPLDPQLQQTIGHRRKMGSRRKNKARLHVNDSGAESDQEPSVDVVGNTRDNETQEDTEETEVQEKSIETLMKETDQFDTAHTEGVSDQVNVNALDDTPVGIADLTSLGLQSSLTAGHLEIDQSNFSFTPDEEPPNVCSVTGKENIEGDEDTEWLRQDGNLRDTYLLSEDMESSFPPEKTREEQSSRERTGPECSGQLDIMSPLKEEVHTNEGQDDNFNSPEVTGDDRSEDAIVKVHEQDVESREDQEKPQIDFSFEKVTHDATDNSEINPRNLMNQIEVSDTHQSMMAVTNTDDSSISLEESSSSLQTHQSEINVPLDPQLQQTIGHRRKMGSRRKNKGRLHVKDSGAESDQEPSVDVVGNTRDNETQEDAEMALKIEPTENLEKPQIDFSFEKVTHDAKDNSEIIPGNLMNQIEVSDTPQSMMAVTNTDDSLINLDNSNPDNTQQEHPKEENYFETSDQTNEDYDVCDTRKTQISEIERVDTCQVFEGDTNPSVDQTAFQEKEELLEESSSSLQTHQSEINVPLDPQLQQTIGHRRKMGSRRKNKARLHVNDSGAESDQEPSVDVVGNTRDNETQEDTEETEVQEKSIETLMKETDQFDTAHTEGVSDQVNENALDDTPVGIADLTSLGLQSSLTAGHLEIDQSNFSFTPDEEPPNVCSVTGKENIEGDEDTEWLRQDGNLRDTYLLSEDMESSFPPEKTREEQSSRERTGPECSGQLDIMSPLKEEVHTNEGQDDNFNSPEVTGDDRSEDAIVKVHEQDVESREDQEKPQIDFSFEKVTHDATDNSEINPRNLMNQIEVSDTHQSMMAVTNTDDSSISLEESSSSLQTHQSEINVPLDPQLQQTIGHRRKMGSRRKNKARLHVKDSGAESDQEPSVDVVGNTRDNETQEDTEETEVQEKSIETLMKETDQFDTAHTEGVSDQVNENALDDTPVGIADLTSLGLQSSLTAGHLEIDQSNFSFTPDEEHPNVCSVTGKENIEGDEDTEWLRQDGNLRDTYLLSEDMESSFPPEKTREEQSSRERTGPECSGQLDIMSPLKEEVHTNEGQDDNFNSPEVTGDDRSEDAVVKVHEQDVESREDQEKPQIDFSFEKVTHDATDNSEINPRNLMNQIEVSDTHQSMMAVTNTDDSSISLEESSSSLQTHQSEINVPLDPQLQQTIGHRRKMGSRRKNKGRLHVKDSGAESDQEPSVDVVGNTRDNETQEDAEMALKIEPTENLEKPQIDFSFEKVTHDATDNSEIIPGNLMNQIEVSDTLQSMMAVTNTDDSLINLDNSNPDNTQQEHPKEENYFETSDQTNEDYDVCDTRKTQISDIERVDTCQVFEGDTNPSVDQTAFQEKEELLEESSSSLQTHQSEINVPLDPQLQQTIGHRRKMGSRRKNKARLHVNDSGAESDQEPSVDVVGNTRDNETQEDTEETEVQEKSIETLMKETDQFDTAHTEGVSDQVNVNALDDTPVGIADLTSLGLQSSLTAGHLEIDQSNFSFTPDEEPPNVCSVTGKENIEGDEDTEWLRQDGNLRDTYLLSEDMESSFPPEKTREEQSSRERTGPECSGQLDIMSPLKEEVHTNEGQDDNFNSPEVTGDDHSEDAVVKVHEQDVESREDQEKPQIDFSFEKVTHDATDNSEINPRNLMNQIEVSDTHQSMMAVTNTDDSSISLEESSSSLQTHQSEINVPLDPQLQQTIGHRRKMGSRRKNKGRLHVKDSGAESDQEPSVDVVGNTRDNETQEDAEMALKIEPTENLEKPQIAFSFEKVTHDATDNSEIIPGNLMNQIEVSDTPQSMMAVTNTDDSLINLDNSNPDNTQQEHPKEENYFETSDQTNEDYDVCDTRKTQISEIERVDTCQVFEGDTNPSVDQTDFQEKEELLEESSSSLQTHQSEINVPLDPQLQQTIGHRRKMGSRRKNKARLHVNDSGAESDQEPSVDVVGNTRDNETQEDTEETEVQEKSIETLMKETDQFDTAHTEGVSDQVNENALDDTPVGIADLTSLGLQSSLTAGHLEIDQSNFSFTPDEEPPNVCSVTGKENIEGDEDTEWLRQDGNLRDTYLLSEDMESSFPPEKTREEQSSRERTGPECSGQLDIMSPLKEEVHTNEGQDDNSNSPEVTGDDHSEDAVVKVHEQDVESREDQEKPQIDFSSEKVTHDATDNSEINPRNLMNQIEVSDTHQSMMAVTNTDDSSISLEESSSSLQTHQSEINVPLDPQLQQTIGHRRKMGSRRKNKGRLHVKDSGAESDQEPSVDVVGNTRDNETQEDAEINSQSNSLVVSSHVKSEDNESSFALEISPDGSPEEPNESECTVERADLSAKQPVNFPHVTGTSQDSVNQKEHESQEMNVSKEMPKVELFSAPQILATCDVGLKQAETAADVPGQSGTSGPQGMQENNNSDDIVILHGRSTQKRRKMGSTRQSQFNGKRREERAETQEGDTETDTRNRVRAEPVEELTTSATAEWVSQSENANLPPGVVCAEQQETHESSAVDAEEIPSSEALPPEQSASIHEEVVDPVEFVHAADVKLHEGSAAVSGEPRNGVKGAASVTPTDGQRVGPVDIEQRRAVISTEAPVVADLETVTSGGEGEAAEEHVATRAMEPQTDSAEEAAHRANPQVKNASPCLEPKDRRRKMGSTRKNLRTGTKQEDSHQTQGETHKVTETEADVADVKTESFPSAIKDERHVDTGDRDGGPETSEHSRASESHKAPAHQMSEEKPVSQGRMLVTEHRVTPSYVPAEPSTPPKDGSMSESAFRGRRRKMGSNRKSQGHQSHDNQTARVDQRKDTENERDVRSVREENAIHTEELREESSTTKCVQVDPRDGKQLSNLSSSKGEDRHARPVSEKTPEPVTAAQHNAAGIQSHRSPQRFSLDDRPDLRSKAYNVMMIGDSSVGKSSFMKRAQSGKFSLDLPASVGLDSCMWTVLVEGKPVVLQLWDTAGQERFHSLAKQTFHKAHAFLLMYDITCSQSFSSVSYWESCIREAAAESVTILLVGNKSDGAERQVKTQEAEILATEYRFEFMECSAATGENVVQCLETMARMLSEKDETSEVNMVLHKEPPKKTSRCC